MVFVLSLSPCQWQEMFNNNIVKNNNSKKWLSELEKIFIKLFIDAF